jgi:hypothetical protein
MTQALGPIPAPQPADNCHALPGFQDASPAQLQSLACCCVVKRKLQFPKPDMQSLSSQKMTAFHLAHHVHEVQLFKEDAGRRLRTPVVGCWAGCRLRAE